MNCPTCGTKLQSFPSRGRAYCGLCREIITDEQVVTAERDALLRQLEHEAQCQSLLRDERDALVAEVERLREKLVSSVPAWARERVRRWQELYRRYPEEAIAENDGNPSQQDA